MTRLQIFFASVVLTVVLVVIGAAAAAAAPSFSVPVGPPAGAGPPEGAGPAFVPPTPVCTPAWGSIVLPICA